MPEIKMPKLSDTMTEGTLIAWKKKKGETVSAGEVLAEIETDKATMEWESSDDGVLTEIYVKEGEKVQVGQALALVLAKGEKAPASNGGAAAGPKAPPAETGPGAQTAKETVFAAPTVSAPRPAATPPPGSSGSTRIKASPLAKKIAAAKGLDLSRITGTGPGSRILQRDVMAATPGTQAQAQAPAVSGSMPIISPVATPDSTRLVLSGMRRTIAERLLASKTQIPHFYLHIEVDMGELLKLRSEINAATEKTDKAKITINDFVLKAAVTAATLVPKVNAAFDRDGVLEYANVNLAVAVAIDDGLVTPVIRDAGKKSLREISEAVKDLAGRARTKKLKPEEYQGGTFTVSNLGSYGIENFYAIINPPQAMILSIGAIVKKPVVNEIDQIVVGQRMSIGMSCDHRVVDGAIGAQYLAELKKLLENPAVMLI